MWSGAESRWVKVGDVVDGPGGSGGGNTRTGEINGVTYDYVFDVDLGENTPTEKLGYNRGELFPPSRRTLLLMTLQPSQKPKMDDEQIVRFTVLSFRKGRMYMKLRSDSSISTS